MWLCACFQQAALAQIQYRGNAIKLNGSDSCLVEDYF